MDKLRKLLVVTVMVATVLSLSVMVIPQAKAAASAGDLIKMDGLSSVYYLGSDSKRYVFPNEKTYLSWYSDFSGVKTVPQSELEGYALAANVVIRPGTKLVKITTNPTVYAVEANGNLRSIVSEANAIALWGADWAKKVVDVPDSFFVNYKIGTPLTEGKYPAGSLVKSATSPDVFYFDGTNFRKFGSEGSFTGNRFSFDNVVTVASTFTITEGGDTINSASEFTDTSQGGNLSPIVGSGLTVALSSNTPASATIIATGLTNAQAAVPFTTVNFTASSDGDVKITNLKFRRAGISSDSDIDSLYLFDGESRLTDAVSISSAVATFNNANGLFTVPKGTTKSITLKGDLYYNATSGKTIGFSLVEAASVTTDGATVTGSFPMAGNLMSTAVAADLGRLSFGSYTNYPSATDQSISTGDDQEVFSLVAQSNEQPLSIERMVFTAVGSIQTADLKNFKLYSNGTKVAEVAAMNSDNQVVFDISPAIDISKGSSKTLSLRANIDNGSTRTFYFSLQYAPDVKVKDTTYGVYVLPYNQTWSTIKPTGNYKVSEGSLSITKSTDSPTDDIVVDGTNVVLAKYDFKASGENIKIKELNLIASTTPAGGIDNGKVYVDGVQVGSTKDIATNNATTTFTFGSTFIVAAGATAKVQIIGDVKTAAGSSYANGSKVLIAIAPGSSNAQRMTSLGTFNSPASGAELSVPANILTMSTASMTVNKFSGYGSQTMVAGSNGAKVGSMVLSAAASQGVNVSSITIALSSSEASSINNLYLKDNATGAQLGDIKVTPTVSNVFSVNFSLAASATKVIDIYADLATDATPGSWAASASANGSGAVTGNSVTASEQELQSMTIGSGNLYVNNGSHPDADILLAGTNDNYMGEFTFTAANEGYTISKLLLKVLNNFATSTAGITIKYTDKAGAEKTASQVFVTNSGSYTTAAFTGLTMYVPKDTDKSLKVYVNLTSIASGATSGATSGIYLDKDTSFTATGDSGVTKSDVGTGDLNGNAFIVRKSKPTFARQAVTGTPSTGSALYKFTVVSDASGNIELKQLGFSAATTGVSITGAQLYDTSTGLPITDSAVEFGANDYVRLIVGGNDDDVLNIGTTAKTYEMRGTVTGWGSGDSITLRFKQDSAATPNANSATINANSYNTWSDRSATNHSTTSTDWTNGYLLKNMTDAQSFSN